MRPLFLLGVGAVLLSCRAPTEITVELKTDIDCALVNDVGIWVGPYYIPPGDPPSTVTSQCSADGTIGSIVVVPAGADNAAVEVLVAAGKGVGAESCNASSDGGVPMGVGCVVARRLLNFVPNDPLYLPIELRNDCVDVPCTETTTCVDGVCKDAMVAHPDLCTTPAACDESTLGPAPDAGAPDAGPSDAGPSDAGPGDAGPSDAGPGDAGPSDAGPGDAGPSDAGPGDAGPSDAGPGDAGPADAGPGDAGPIDPVVEVAASTDGTTCARTMGNKIWCWGTNDDYKLGIGDGGVADAGLPVTQAMTSVTAPTGLGLASSFFCVLQSGGGVSCAGNGQHGQLGNGVFGSSATPVNVDFGTSFATSIVVGDNHACAPAGIHTQCWGAGTGGQLGPISSSDIAKPMGFSLGDAGVVIGAGGDTTCIVLLPAGKVDCFGSNLEGQLDLDAGTTSSASPQGVLAGASNVWVSSTAACALVDAGAQCWGQADGKDTFSPPSAVGGLGNVQQVALGATGGCALLMTHEIYCWGANDVGQLGTGSQDLSNHYPPTTPVTGISDAVWIARSDDHACAVHSDGTVSCWGQNLFGQVSGDGQPAAFSATPVRVPLP